MDVDFFSDKNHSTWSEQCSIYFLVKHSTRLRFHSNTIIPYLILLQSNLVRCSLICIQPRITWSLWPCVCIFAVIDTHSITFHVIPVDAVLHFLLLHLVHFQTYLEVLSMRIKMFMNIHALIFALECFRLIINIFI